jgi:Protein of unknown function (DUF4232)
MRRTRTSLVAGILAATLALVAVPAAFAAHQGAQAAPANCVRNQLGVRPNGISGAAGTIRRAWVFTNISKSTCKLYGYPGMQLFGRAGRPIPTTVKRNLAPGPTTVTLTPNASATFISSASDVPSGSSGCPMSAVVQITAPNAFASLFIPARMQACRGLVRVSAVRAGVHTP